MLMPPVVDINKCRGHGECHTVCPADPNVFEIRGGLAHVVNPDSCIMCGACVAACPEVAITLE